MSAFPNSLFATRRRRDAVVSVTPRWAREVYDALQDGYLVLAFVRRSQSLAQAAREFCGGDAIKAAGLMELALCDERGELAPSTVKAGDVITMTLGEAFAKARGTLRRHPVGQVGLLDCFA